MLKCEKVLKEVESVTITENRFISEAPWTSRAINVCRKGETFVVVTLCEVGPYVIVETDFHYMIATGYVAVLAVVAQILRELKCRVVPIDCGDMSLYMSLQYSWSEEPLPDEDELVRCISERGGVEDLSHFLIDCMV